MSYFKGVSHLISYGLQLVIKFLQMNMINKFLMYLLKTYFMIYSFCEKTKLQIQEI